MNNAYFFREKKLIKDKEGSLINCFQVCSLWWNIYMSFMVIHLDNRITCWSCVFQVIFLQWFVIIKKGEIVGFLALNLKLIYFNYSINLCFDDNKSDFFIDNFINLNRPYRRAWKNDSNASWITQIEVQMKKILLKEG